MIDQKHALPMVRQAKLLEMSRSSLYYRPQPASESDLRLMRRIDELHLEHPFAGARMLRDMLRLDGIDVGRKRVGTLMRTLSIEAHQPAQSGASDLSLSPARPRHRPPEPGLGDGHDVHSDAARIRLSVRRTRLGYGSMICHSSGAH